MNSWIRNGKNGILKSYVSWISAHAFWLIAILLLALLFCPTGFIVEEPGPTMDVLGPAVLDYGYKKVDLGGEAIKAGNPNFDPKGALDMVTVNVVGSPSSPLPVFYVICNYFNRDASILPREVVFPIGSSVSSDSLHQEKLMEAAKAASENLAVKFVREHNLSKALLGLKGIRIKSGSIGGPSAGLIFTLGLIEKLSGKDLTGGKSVAGTGTIDESGKVGQIGGVRSKMIAAKRDGASFFLAPKANCAQILAYRPPKGLKVIPVSNLDQAYAALRNIAAGKTRLLPYCEA